MGKISAKDKKNRIKNKKQKPKTKAKQARFVDVQDAELLSKDQLKKIKQNRTCATRVSGKRKHKLLKRIRHQQKEKIRMDIETDIPQKKQTSKKDQSNNKMETDS
ncbi:uncharacterized protein LOC134705593 [Mytilus trossulus]|uniref:uncharacterized protein LOC134705593 n=1 Tax=Mytilus trossulus TaxID=6551 RepID=UPI003005064D